MCLKSASLMVAGCACVPNVSWVLHWHSLDINGHLLGQRLIYGNFSRGEPKNGNYTESNCPSSLPDVPSAPYSMLQGHTNSFLHPSEARLAETVKVRQKYQYFPYIGTIYDVTLFCGRLSPQHFLKRTNGAHTS